MGGDHVRHHLRRGRIAGLQRVFRHVAQREQETPPQQRAQGEKPRADHEQTPRAEAAHHHGDHAPDGIGRENVAKPDDVGVEHAEKQQPQHPPVMHAGRLRILVLPHHQHDSGPEKGGEDGDELHFEEDVREKPDTLVRAGEIQLDRGVHVGLRHHRKGLHIHHQNTENRDAPQGVNRLDPAGARR